MSRGSEASAKCGFDKTLGSTITSITTAHHCPFTLTPLPRPQVPPQPCPPCRQQPPHPTSSPNDSNKQLTPSLSPLKAQLAIRDHWTAPSSPVQTSLSSLSTLLGHSITANPEWSLIIADLDAFYPDKANLVAIVAGCVQAWAKSMTELLEDSAHEAWADKLLDKVPVRLQLFVEVAGAKEAKGGTSWSEARDGFVLALPRSKVVQPAELFPIFRGGLLACFDEPGKVVPVMERKAAAAAAAAAGGDDWEGVEVDTTTGKAEVTAPPPRRQESATTARPRVEFLPVVASLPRPDELFLQPPYHLSLSHGHQHIEVQCSHSPTLQLLADYLKRWCRVNHSDSRNVCDPSLTPLPLSSRPHPHRRPTINTDILLPAPRRAGTTAPVRLWAGRDVRPPHAQHGGHALHDPVHRHLAHDRVAHRGRAGLRAGVQGRRVEFPAGHGLQDALIVRGSTGERVRKLGKLSHPDRLM